MTPGNRDAAGQGLGWVSIPRQLTRLREIPLFRPRLPETPPVLAPVTGTPVTGQWNPRRPMAVVIHPLRGFLVSNGSAMARRQPVVKPHLRLLEEARRPWYPGNGNTVAVPTTQQMHAAWHAAAPVPLLCTGMDGHG